MANINIKFETKPKLPAFYKSEYWIKSIGKMSLKQRLQYRLNEVAKKLPAMTILEKYEMWCNEPYYEVSKIIAQSLDWKFPKDKDGK